MMLALVMLSFCLFWLASPCLGNQWLHIYLAPSYIPSQVPPERKLQLDHGAASHLFQTLFFRRHASTRVPNQARMTGPAYSPSNPPEISIMAPTAAPVLSPKYHGSFANPPISKHHRRGHHATSPISLSPPPDCDDIFCSEPLTRTPIGSPCGCVSPMQVVIDVGVAPYLLFTEIAELALEVAAGTFLKQSQVKIMGANASIRGQEKTTVTIYLVPLGEKFDRTTALLIYERFWQKKVPIRKSNFHDYEVIYVHYPGLPSSPPSSSGGSSALGPSASGGHQYPFTANVPSGKSQKLNARIISLVAVSSFIVVLACIVVACIVFKSKKLGCLPADPEPVTLPPATKRSGMKSIIPSSVASSISVSFVSTMVTCPPSVKTFSLAELEKATDGFNTMKILGEGGSGRVYHGTMQDGREVAVKVLTRENQDSDREREFIAEVEMLSRLHHRNLVKLIGVCIEGHKRCLVYELVRNGSVESHLHGVDKRKGLLDWDARMKIALGAARALAYLHEDSNPRVIHRDFKASNVLLEDDFNPKVSDFGLAREASEGTNHISTRVMGTFGYVAPEYAMTGHLLVKSDVYSYGVVLLELLSGRKPVYMSEPRGPENLVTWARPLLTNREGLEQLVDPLLQGNFDFDNMARVAAIASMCVHIEPSQRPFMGEVVQALKLIYKDTDEACEDSYSQRESTSAPDFDMKADYGPESSWWSGGSPCYGRASPFITMDYSSGPMGEIERPHSTSSLVGRGESATAYNRSGPLRTKRKKSSFYRLRGSMSEHGYPLRHFPLNGSQDFGL